MPVYSHDYNSNVYDPAAPVVEIVVRRTSPRGAEETLLALVDSGADATMLPISVLTGVGARFLETRQMRGATGHRLVVDTYLVTIRLGPHTLYGIQPVAMREGIEAVIGRDVLNQLEVVLNGPAHVVEIVACPDHVFTCLGDDAPAFLNVLQAQSIFMAEGISSLALLCSAKAPASILLAVHDLAQRWRHGPQVIISGFHSPVEQEAFEILLRGPGRVIYCPARGLPKRLKPTWRTALDAGRLTLISPFPDTIRRATKKTAVFRNRFLAALADTVLIAYAHPDSSTEQLAKEVLGWGKPVRTLHHESTVSLRAIGVKLFEE